MMDLETPVAVYVPAEDSHLGIDPASGIVGRLVPDAHGAGEDRALIYYEGNRFGYSNVVTFADRCNIAHGRYVESAPTIAQAFPQAGEVYEVGTFYRQHGRVEVSDGLALTRLARWLGLYDGEDLLPQGAIDTDALARELRCTGRVFA